jgi:hypothetical protein
VSSDSNGDAGNSGDTAAVLASEGKRIKKLLCEMFAKQVVDARYVHINARAPSRGL